MRDHHKLSSQISYLICHINKISTKNQENYGTNAIFFTFFAITGCNSASFLMQFITFA